MLNIPKKINKYKSFKDTYKYTSFAMVTAFIYPYPKYLKHRLVGLGKKPFISLLLKIAYFYRKGFYFSLYIFARI